MSSISRRHAVSGRILTISSVCVAAALLSSCMANPSDAPTVEGAPEPPEQKQVQEDQQKKMREVSVGVDEFVEGFNPHLLQDMSPVTSLVARLTLPSAFVPDPQTGDNWLMNEDLLESAVAVDAGASGATEHVRYTIRQGAQWSDGTPISGEDFRYLYSQVTSNPGALDLASYELIKSIAVSEAGRQIDVTFKHPVMQWKHLFASLLPAHLMRTSTDGFSLASHFPASGGQYTVDAMDVGRNVIRLVRNDRYWGKTQATSEVVTLRAMRSAIDGAEQMRSSQLQAAQIRPAQTTALTYSLVPGASEFIHEPPRSLVFSTNLAAPRLKNEAIRKALLSTINVEQVAEVATGRSAADSAEAQVSSSAVSRPENAQQDQAGGNAVPADQFSRVFNRDNPLRIGVVSDGLAARAAAFAVSNQLTSAGIPAVVVPTEQSDLLRTDLPFGTVDAVVSWSTPATTMAAARDRYSCTSGAVGSLAPERTEGSSASARQTESSTEKSSEGAAPTAIPSRERDQGDDSAESIVAPSSAARGQNLTGLCDPKIDRLLSPDTPEVPASLGQEIQARSIELNLVDDALLTVIGPSIEMRPRGQDKDPAQWPNDPVVGRLVGLGSVARVASASDVSAEDKEEK